MPTVLPRRRTALQFNMTPLIDIVFQLIIFFLAASHLARVESSQKVDLPEAESGQAELDAVTRRMLTVLPDETVLVGSKPITRARLGEMLRELAAERPGGEVEIRIRADRAAPYRAIEPLLLECARSGIWKVTFAVLRETNRPASKG